MFPIPFNFPFRKSNGNLTTIGAAINEGGGGEPYVLPTASANVKGGIKIGNRLTMVGDVLNADAELPAYSQTTAGKVLTVGDDGSLEWDVKGTGGGTIYDELLIPIFRYSSPYYEISGRVGYTTRVSDTPQFSNNNYDLNDVFYDVANDYSIFEYFGYVNSDLITALNLTELGIFTSGNVNAVTLSEPFTNFDFILIQGCYDASGASSYDTSMIYISPAINTPYWFGMKDRNSSYSGLLTFTDTTHGTIDESRRLKIYGGNI